MYSPATDTGCLLSLNVANNPKGLDNNNAQPDKNRLSDLSGYAADTSRAGSACSSTYVPPAPTILNRLSQISGSSGSSAGSFINPYAQPMEPAILTETYKRYMTERWKNAELLLTILDELEKNKIVRSGFIGSRVELGVINENYYFKPNIGIVKNSPKRTKRPQTQRDHGSKRSRGDDDIPIGTTVFARQPDSKYFAAKVIKRSSNKKWLVEFYDGTVRNVTSKNIIYDYMDLIMGRRVLVMGDDRVSYPAIISECKVVNGIPMMMALTNEGDFEVPLGKIYITENQLKTIKAEFESPIPQKRVARSPRITKPLANKSLAKHDNAVACTSGTVKALPCASRAQPMATSSSEYDEIPEPPVNTAVHITGCEEEVLLQPPAPECAIKLKNISGKLPRSTNQIDDNIVGPIVSGQWFKGMFFLLTSNSRSVNVIANMDASTDSEDFQFTNIPFVYDRLELQIRLGQGTILYSTKDIPPNQLNNTYLIAPRPCLTQKYIECLALDITVLCHEWVINCCKMQTRIALQDLPLGWSVEHQRYIKADDKPYTNVFRSIRIQIAHNSNAPFYDFWSRIIRCLGGRVTKFIGDWINADFILVENGYRNEGLYIAEQSVALVSTTWVVQSLILRKPREAKGHVLYNPHFEDCESS